MNHDFCENTVFHLENDQQKTGVVKWNIFIQIW